MVRLDTFFGNLSWHFRWHLKKKLINMTACRDVLRSFSLSETETSVEQNLWWACTHHDSLMCQQVAAEDALEMA